ncbi:AAA family ATPase [Frondihabitans australicus]|uniref:NadR type nicotinamide-nucleotide adenylyltransferase n=1 Tax=Frondihabitans australicus TaxID=386892 RepID=A0A495ICT5_9MICO|nr:AAA family ATPase [Frondihabitans australicus]RKR73824.1 NadR type nicotinamide-nucleotide adenylyltransferase [Frondihabitans australicus]
MADALATGRAKRFARGLVLGKFYPLHAGHSNLIRAGLVACEELVVEVLGSSVESIPLETRVAWLREEHPTATVVSAMDDAPIDYGDPAVWELHMRVIESLLPGPVDAVFSSDSYGEELADRLGAEWVCVDPDRTATPISGTAVRDDPAASWWALAPCVRATLAPRVVVLGAESTGSTTLAEALAERLETLWVPEYGREHTIVREGGLETPWRSDEFDLIVDRQIGLEDAALRRVPRPLLLCDTDVLATALWHERYVGSPAPAVLARASAHAPALYVLTGDDIPFVQDGYRDGEHIRHAMQQRFRDELAAREVPWLEVTGTVAERVEQALPAIAETVRRALTYAVPLTDPSVTGAGRESSGAGRESTGAGRESTGARQAASATGTGPSR